MDGPGHEHEPRIDLLVIGGGMAGLAAAARAAQDGASVVLVEKAPRTGGSATVLATYVAEVVPAITFTFSGLLIDPSARVLDADGNAIPGLLAAGADTGGLWCRAYAGGLATALVFGLQAARTALAAAPPVLAAPLA